MPINTLLLAVAQNHQVEVPLGNDQRSTFDRILPLLIIYPFDGVTPTRTQENRLFHFLLQFEYLTPLDDKSRLLDVRAIPREFWPSGTRETHAGVIGRS